MYVNRKEGFVGTGLKRDEYVTDCSDIDDVICFTREGKMVVTKVDDKGRPKWSWCTCDRWEVSRN